MKLLLVAADAMELRETARRMDAVEPVKLRVDWARRGRLNGVETVLVANGVGRTRAAAATEAALNEWTAEVVVSTGFCGALDGALSVADVVVATSITDGKRQFATGNVESPRRFQRGVVYCSPRVAGTRESKAELFARGARVVEMEAAGVAEVAEKRGLPLYAVRVVSDLADETMANDFNAALRSDGHFDTMRILRGGLRRPWTRFPELLRMRNRCSRAALALGDFFADCRF